MSVIRRASIAQPWEPDQTGGWPVPGVCFYCSDRLREDALFWLGSHVLVLHPSCGVKLCVALLADAQVHKYEVVDQGPR